MADLLTTLQDYQHILLAGLLIVGYFKYKEMQKTAIVDAEVADAKRHEIAKAEIKSALSNGISDMVSRMNKEQDERWIAGLRQVISDHERHEESNMRRLIEDTLGTRKRGK
jgi:hypothetical protein